MTKISKLFVAVLMALGMIVPAQAAEVTLFDGTAGVNTVPINIYWLDAAGTQTQVIYPETALAGLVGRPINSMKFYLDQATSASGGVVNISLGIVDTDQFEVNEFFTVDMTQVASYTFAGGETELLITFNEPFVYNGGNLLLDTYVAEAGTYDNASTNFIGKNPYYNAAKSRSQLVQFIPKTTFDYTPAYYAASVDLAELTFKPIRVGNDSEELIVEVINTGLNAFTPAINITGPFSTTAQPVALQLGESMQIPVKFVPTEEGDFTGELTIDCGEAGLLTVELSGKALPAADEYTVCEGDGTQKSPYLPVYGFYYDVAGGQDQMIYPAEKLTDMVGKEIFALTFHPTTSLVFGGGNIQLSLKEIDEAAFEEDNTTLYTDLTVVANVVPVKNDENLTIYFDEPYTYNGGNLLIETLVTESGSWGTTEFYGETSDELNSVCFYINNSGATYSVAYSFLPKATFTCKKGGVEPVVKPGDVNNDGSVTIGDVTALIDYLLGGASGEFNEANADVNGDEGITIGDVTALIDYLLSGGAAE